MPAKAPIYLKNAGGNKGNKKLREILSTDMISAPLGDFRHTAHVGRRGSHDMFGDTSFIQNQDNLATILKTPAETTKVETDGKESIRSSSEDGTSNQPEDQPNALQSALSLPHLKSTDNGNIPESSQTLKKVYSKSQEDVSEVHTESESSSTTETEHSVVEGPPKPKRVLSKVSATSQNDSAPMADDNHSGSPLRSPSKIHSPSSDNDDWKFDLDMGPSLVDEVMGLIKMRLPNQ